MRAWVIGNGPSLAKTPLELLAGERTYAVNRIWRLFDKTKWRPSDYVRSELPDYDGSDVIEDLRAMSKVDCRIWVQAGFYRYASRRDVMFGKPCRMFLTCGGREVHDWHFDLGDYICGYGTVVNQAVQIAVLEGATEVCLLGCDLGAGHFHAGDFVNSERALAAHKTALMCSPVPIYNCTIGGELEVYPRRSMEDVLREGV